MPTIKTRGAGATGQGTSVVVAKVGLHRETTSVILMRFSLHLKLSRLVVAFCFRSLFSDAFSFTNNNRRLVSRPKPSTTTTKTKATPWLVHIRPADDRWRLHAIPKTEEKDARVDENNNYDDDGDGDDNDAARLWSLTLANLSTRKRNVNPGTEDDNYDIDDVDDDDDEPGVLCDFLLELGACAAYLVDADRGTDLEEPIYGEPLDASFFDQLDREYDNAGDTTDHTKSLLSPPPVQLWKHCTLTAQFPASIDLDTVLTQISTTFPNRYPNLLQSYRTERIPNRDWVVQVQQGWNPIVVGVTKSKSRPMVLRFPWHTPDDVHEAVRAARAATATTTHPDDFLELQLQGGIAFGTGEHPTTQLCLEWITQTVQEELQQRRQQADGDDVDRSAALSVLDYGTGSGVLGLAACAMAPGAVTAVGIDLDYDCCRIANANAALNQLASQMQSYLPPVWDENADDESKSLLLKAYAHAKRLGQKQGDAAGQCWFPDALQTATFDIGVANILAGPLVTLAPTLARMIRPGGKLGLSGILQRQQASIVQAYTAAGFEQVRVHDQREGWVLMTGTRAQQ